MTKIGLSTIILILSFQSCFAGEFKFNYKNLNALASLICSNNQPSTAKDEVLVSKFSINKTKLSQRKNDLKIEISGTCNAKVNVKSKDVISFGEDLQIEFDLNKLNQTSGNIGLSKIKFKFKKNQLLSLNLRNPFTLKNVHLKLSKTVWSNKSSIISFGNKDQIKLRIGARIIASESNSNLKVNNGPKYYNIWGFDTIGCKARQSLTQAGCENFSEKL